MGSLLRNFLAFLYFPSTWLTFFFGVASLPWLLYLGKWMLVFNGILASLLFPKFFVFINLPQIGLNKLGEKYLERNHFAAMAFIAIGITWQNAVMSLWCILVFMGCITQSTTENLIASIFFANCIAVMPIYYMARFDRGHFASELMVSLATVVMLTYTTMFIFFHSPTQYYFYSAIFYALVVPLSAFIMEISRKYL